MVRRVYRGDSLLAKQRDASVVVEANKLAWQVPFVNRDATPAAISDFVSRASGELAKRKNLSPSIAADYVRDAWLEVGRVRVGTDDFVKSVAKPWLWYHKACAVVAGASTVLGLSVAWCWFVYQRGVGLAFIAQSVTRRVIAGDSLRLGCVPLRSCAMNPV